MAKQKTKEVLKPLTWQQSDAMTAINPDLVLEYSTTEGYEAYEKMEIDPYIFKNLMIAKSYPNNYNYTFEQGNTEAVIYNYIKDKFSKNKPGAVDLQTVYNAVVNADFYGFSVLQPLFNNRELSELYDFKAKNFTFNNAGDLKLAINAQTILETAKGENYSFIVIRNNQTDNNFFGTGLAMAIYYLRELRKSLAKTKQIVADKYGVTPWVALTEFNADQEKEYKATVTGASTVMESLRGGGFGVINGKNTQLLPLTNTLSINDIEAVDKEIGITITGIISGSTDSIESAASGSQARATVQNEIVKIVQGRRLAMIEKAVNTLVRWIIDIKFGTDKAAPYFSFNTANIPQFDDLMTAYNSGIPVQRELLTPYIGDEKGTMIVKAPDQTQPLQFAETSKKKILNLKI